MKIIPWLFLLLPFCLFSQETISLKDNLDHAQKGDYIVISQGKSFILFHIFDHQKDTLTVEEVTIPSTFATQNVTSWKSWLEDCAPYNTSWVLYQIDLKEGVMKNYYSFTKQGWYQVPQADNFLQTLLHLKLSPLPTASRPKIGHLPRHAAKDTRPLWQPKMVFEGKTLEGIPFNAYQTEWPKDGSPLSGKTVELYLPSEPGNYPNYFPYWLQVKGTLAQGKVRIIDSGKNARSPQSGYPSISKL